MITMLVLAAVLEAFWSSSTTITFTVKYWVGAVLWALVASYFLLLGTARWTLIRSQSRSGHAITGRPSIWVSVWPASIGKALFAAWLVVFLPLAYIIHLIFGAGSSWGLLVIWWLKPVFDRVPLIVLSRAVFGSEPSVRETLASTPAALSPGVLPSLTLQRFDAARSFNLPVWQLESLRGKAWGQRVRTMEKRTKGAAGWHTVSCLCLVFIVFFALFALLGWMTPNEAGISLWWYFGEHFWEWLWPFGDEAPLWFGVLMNAPHVSAVAIIEPFYVAGGFTLYLKSPHHPRGLGHRDRVSTHGAPGGGRDRIGGGMRACALTRLLVVAGHRLAGLRGSPGCGRGLVARSLAARGH